MNKCKILRDLMVTLDRITANGVVKGQCQHVASKLGEYCAGGELLDISDKFESYKVGMSYDMYVKEVPIETRYEHLNAHFAATNIQLGGVTWDAIMRIWVEFRSKYVTIKHVLDNGQVSGAPIGDILNGVTRMMHLIETYHGK